MIKKRTETHTHTHKREEKTHILPIIHKICCSGEDPKGWRIELIHEGISIPGEYYASQQIRQAWSSLDHHAMRYIRLIMWLQQDSSESQSILSMENDKNGHVSLPALLFLEFWDLFVFPWPPQFPVFQAFDPIAVSRVIKKMRQKRPAYVGFFCLKMDR